METNNKRLTISGCKKQAKANMGRQSADLMLIGFAAVVITSLLSAVTVMLGAFFIYGAVEYGLSKTFYRNSIGETITPNDALDGFKDKFGEAFLAGFVVQVIYKVPKVLRILNYIAILYSILAILGIGDFGQSDIYSDFGQGVGIMTALLSLLTYFMILQYSMAQYILMREEDAKALHALRMSRQAMGPYIIKYFILRLSFILWGLLSVITLGLSNVYSKAYYTATETVFFNEVYEAFKSDDEGHEELASIEDDEEDNQIGGIHIG